MSLLVWLPLNGNLNNQGINNIIMTGSPTYGDGKIGKGAIFGASSAISTSSNMITLGDSFSVSFWIKITNWVDWGRIFNLYKDANTYISCCLSTTEGKSIGTQVYSNSTKLHDGYTSNITENQWMHFTLTVNKDIKKHYINGVLHTTVTMGGIPTSSNYYVKVGGNRDGAAPAACCMNDFRVYDHCLSDKEVKEISKGLIIHYPLNDLIGNPNEISNSMPYDNVSGYSPAGTGWGAPTLVDNDFSPSGKVVRSTYTGSGGNSGGVHHQPYDYSALENGAVYTFSVWVRASKPVPMNIYSEMMTSRSITMPITISTEWTHVIISGPVNNTAQYHSNVVYCSGTDVTTNMWIEAFGFKLEKGSKATPWIPHTTDAQYNIINSDVSICHDTSGYNNNGTISSTKPVVCSDTPRYFSGFQFSNNTYISSVTPTATIYTFSWWGNLNNVSGKMMWGYANGNRLNLYMSNGYFCWNTGDSENNKFGTISTASYADNNWHHFAITSDGTTVKLYIDGVFKANATTYKAITGTSLIFNGWNTANDYNFNGKLSDFRLYMTCLSESDIKELYNAPIHIDNTGKLYTSEISEV